MFIISKDQQISYPENLYFDLLQHNDFILPPDIFPTFDRVLNSLDPTEKDLILLRYQQGMSFSDIAKALNIKNALAAERKLSEARCKLTAPSRMRALAIGFTAYTQEKIDQTNLSISEYEKKIAIAEQELSIAHETLYKLMDVYDMVQDQHKAEEVMRQVITHLPGLSSITIKKLRGVGYGRITVGELLKLAADSHKRLDQFLFRWRGFGEKTVTELVTAIYELDQDKFSFLNPSITQ